MIVIQANHVHKYFHYHHQKTLKEFAHALLKGHKTREFVHAIRDMSFTIRQGEVVGIVGKNGAGKSTLLQLIAGVSMPSEGTLEVRGRIAPFISLGAGFHPDLTGEENIILNGVLLGLTEVEIRKKMPDIIAFSELDENFIQTPVKFYSSGMYMRLAFSVGVFTDPTILLIDEILAVGDEEFRKKCFAKLEEFRKDGVTIIFVSHDLAKVAEFCERILYIQNGKLVYDGKPKMGLKKFRKDLHLL